MEQTFTKEELDIIAKGLLVLNASQMTVNNELVAVMNKVYKLRMEQE